MEIKILKRRWYINGGKIKEMFIVKKDNIPLAEFETENEAKKFIMNYEINKNGREYYS